MRLKGTMGSRLRCWPTDLAPGQCKQLVKHVLWPLRGNGGPCHEHSAECGEALHSRWTRAGVDGALPPASRQARAAAAPRPCRRTTPAPRRCRRRCRACTTHSMLVRPPWCRARSVPRPACAPHTELSRIMSSRAVQPVRPCSHCNNRYLSPRRSTVCARAGGFSSSQGMLALQQQAAMMQAAASAAALDPFGA